MAHTVLPESHAQGGNTIPKTHHARGGNKQGWNRGIDDILIAREEWQFYHPKRPIIGYNDFEIPIKPSVVSKSQEQATKAFLGLTKEQFKKLNKWVGKE